MVSQLNNEHKNVTKKKALELKQTKMLKSSHVLIAIVALIECLILLTFTTYSWIESSSSLVIMNGPKSAVDAGDDSKIENINITDTLDYRINIDTSGTLQDVNNFFRKVKYYEYSKCTSSDGINFFFPRRNNTNVNASTFRRGDTTDYNTSYYYFDFVVNNSTRYGKDFYFDEDYCYTIGGAKTIFNATSDDADLTAVYGDGTTNPNNYTRLDALRGAMRMSISTQIGTGATDTRLYSSFATSGYKSINPNVTPYNDTQLTPSGNGSEVTTHNITQYVYQETNGTPTSSKLFNARKNKETKVSIRMWFDMLDPNFQTAFGFSTSTHSFDTDLFAKIPAAVIGVKFALKCTDNDYQAVYFDDYTFSNTAAAHLSDEQNNYSMWFYAYQPATTSPQRAAGYRWLKMNKDDAASERNRWYTGEATLTMMGTDPGEGMQGSYLANAKFVYAPDANNDGTPETGGSGVYTWKLPAAPPDDYYFNAYSYTPYWNSNSGSATYYGVGVWDDGDANSMVYLKFKDMATGTTDVAYNGSTGASKSFQYMNYSASNSSRSVVYVDNDSTGLTQAVAQTTAGMHYNNEDSDDPFFESYVPKSWLSGNSSNAYFSYCPDGYYGKYYATQRWSGLSPNNSATGTYTYTALGYTDSATSNSNNARLIMHYNHSTSNVLPGVGTWGDVERINLSTELIDSDHIADYRYFIGITGYSSSSLSSSKNYYPMTPDATNTLFYAYVPKDYGKSSALINFVRYNTYRTANQSASINARWFGNRRNDCSTFYPVSISTGTTTDYTRGYWNLSVLVDGSYENLIYATVVTDNATSGGTLQYSTDGSTWSSAIMLDRYRWYAPADGSQTISTVYWKWTPYQAGSYQKTVTVNGTPTTTTVSYGATIFNYTHNLSNGLYKVVTEKPNAVTATGIENGPALSGALQDDDDAEDVDTEDSEDEDLEDSEDEDSEDLDESSEDLSDDETFDTSNDTDYYYDYTEEE